MKTATCTWVWFLYSYSNFKGTGEKNPVMETHLYTCMASLAETHNFSWSRWNLLSGRRSCILLMREIIENRKTVYNNICLLQYSFFLINCICIYVYGGRAQPLYSTLHVTPLKACLVDCTDVSPCFNPIGVEGMGVSFYSIL